MSDRIPTLADLQERYSAIVRQLLGPCASGPINTRPRHDGTPHIETRDGGWEYVVTDRALVIVSVDVTTARAGSERTTRYRTRVTLDLVDGAWLVASLDEVV